MPSLAFRDYLLPLLVDAENLNDARVAIQDTPEGQLFRPSLNRAAVVMCLSAWEAFIEQLVLEAVDAIRPASPAMGTWPTLYATVHAAVRRFNTPNADNVRRLVSDATGLIDVPASWSWPRCSATQARARLEQALTYRHQIAHGFNPRPVVRSPYASSLPDFFRRLGRATDAAVRGHLVDALGVPNPWPP